MNVHLHLSYSAAAKMTFPIYLVHRPIDAFSSWRSDPSSPSFQHYKVSSSSQRRSFSFETSIAAVRFSGEFPFAGLLQLRFRHGLSFEFHFNLQFVDDEKHVTTGGFLSIPLLLLHLISAVLRM
ncbi:unnamed protein product [Vicia faba]|uniref:Uncharacterized protein n=1 Tax=Vicia faba TaxID=3906 RepID=A0AAV1BA33_VICFA|nr:unnamed protein product [Vicia faba]